MRMMLKFSIDNEAGNRVVDEGRVGQVIGKLSERLAPEAAYFFAENGRRTSIYVFDMKDSSQWVGIGELLWHEFNADVTLVPVMNQDDLQAGVAALEAA